MTYYINNSTTISGLFIAVTGVVAIYFYLKPAEKILNKESNNFIFNFNILDLVSSYLILSIAGLGLVSLITYLSFFFFFNVNLLLN